MEEERRRSLRRRVTRGRVYLDVPRPHWAELLDVSASGMRLGTPHALLPGAPVQVASGGAGATWPLRRGVVVHVQGSIVGIVLYGPVAVDPRP